MSREPQPTGYFQSYGVRSEPIRCMDVLDSFPCLHCGAGLEGRNLRCRDEAEASRAQGSHRRWEDAVQVKLSTPDPKIMAWAAEIEANKEPRP